MSVSKRIRFEILKRDNFTCRYCGAKAPDAELEVDHVHPKSAGGTDAMENLTTACWTCNRGKGAEPLASSAFVLIGGPLDARIHTFEKKYPLPFLWVSTDTTSTYHTFEDEWVQGRIGDGFPLWFLRWGHPWKCGGLRSGPNPNAFQLVAKLGREPHVIGGYGTPPRPWDEEPLRSLEWNDANSLIEMLT